MRLVPLQVHRHFVKQNKIDNDVQLLVAEL